MRQYKFGETMDAQKLFDALQKKLNLKSAVQIASFLGLTPQTVATWSKQKAALSPSQVAAAVIKARKAAVMESQSLSIKAVVEYYPIEATPSKHDKAWEVFDSGENSTDYAQGVKKALADAKGIYVFYDSRGHALYVGKARDQSIWKEMNLAFNRHRDVQQVKLTSHPDRNQKFLLAYDKLRQPVPTKVKLYDLAYYFSAYEVDRGMIENIEALMVRAFANNIMNVKMEKLAAHRN